MAYFSRVVNNILTSIKTITTSAGAADSDKIPSTNTSGFLDPTIVNASQTGGASHPNVVIQAGADGLMSNTFLPDGIGEVTFTAIASEAIGSGKNVNEWNDGGVMKVRLADNSGGKPSDGFTKSSFASGATATYYSLGTCPTTGATVGDVYLGTNGDFTSTAPVEGSGAILQSLGTAASATNIYYRRELPILLASL